MPSHRYFRFKTLDDIRREAGELHLDMIFDDEVQAVFQPVRIGDRTAGNAFVIQPMEGCDGTLDGRPGELTFRRWHRFASGGAKLIWGEATAVVPEGRANPRQLYLAENTLSAFEKLLSSSRKVHRERYGTDGDFLIGLQLTHSGRWSYRKPILAAHHPYVDAVTCIDKKRGLFVREDYQLIGDDELERLEDAYVVAAKHAESIGFDFIDIKQCHTYLLNELLGARNRGGKYGGSFENRTRFIRNVLDKIHDRAGNTLIVASRINAYDGIPFSANAQNGVGEAMAHTIPYECGFGIDPSNPGVEDVTEPIQLVRLMKDRGVRLLNVSLGSPYYNPHIGRPYERPSEGSYVSPEHPLIGVDRHFRITGAIQKAFPDLVVVGTGYSWLQKYFVHAAESNLKRKRVSMIGVGRGALAYPDFANDLMVNGALNQKKVCLTVSFCTDLMRAKNNSEGQYPAGCVPRDELYAEEYKEMMKKDSVEKNKDEF